LAIKILVNIDDAIIVSIAQNIAYLRKAIAPIEFSAYPCQSTVETSNPHLPVPALHYSLLKP
jgi:hypothetical protein